MTDIPDAAIEATDYAQLPTDPGTCMLDDSAPLLAFAVALHANVPEEKRPIGWSDFSDEQRERLKVAYRALCAALPHLSTPTAGGLTDMERRVVELARNGGMANIGAASLEKLVAIIDRLAASPGRGPDKGNAT